MAKLTNKQQKFVDEYLIDLNATQAAIRAGYSPISARQIADKNMSKDYIKIAIDKELADRSKRTGINQDRVLQELAKIAFLNPSDVINMRTASVNQDASRDDLSCIASVKIKTSTSEFGDSIEREIKTYDKLKALDLICRHLGMFNDKIKVEGVIPVVIKDDLGETDD